MPVTLSGRGGVLSDTTRLAPEPFEGNYLYVPCNVQKKESLQNLWEASLSKWNAIDIWINNAGQNAPYSFSWETGDVYIENIIQTNAR